MLGIQSDFALQTCQNQRPLCPFQGQIDVHQHDAHHVIDRPPRQHRPTFLRPFQCLRRLPRSRIVGTLVRICRQCRPHHWSELLSFQQIVVAGPCARWHLLCCHGVDLRSPVQILD